MKIRTTPFLALSFAGCLAAAGWAALPSTQAQTASPSPSALSTPMDRTAHGHFQSAGGISGTYVETYTMSDTTTTDTIVYTLADSTETSTETLTTTTNTDGTKVVVFSDLGFGATVAFTSNATYTTSKGGSAVGTGTFTAADGTTGVLAAVVARNGQTSIMSTDFTSATGVLTRQVRLEEKGGGGDTIKTLDVDAAGMLTTTTLTRYGGMHRQHP